MRQSAHTAELRKQCFQEELLEDQKVPHQIQHSYWEATVGPDHQVMIGALRPRAEEVKLQTWVQSKRSVQRAERGGTGSTIYAWLIICVIPSLLWGEHLTPSIK